MFRGSAASPRGGAFSLAQKRRLEQGIRRRAEQLGLVGISEIRIERGKMRIQAIMPPHLRLQNVERALQGALTGIMKKEFPHLTRGPTPRGGENFGVPF